MAKNASQQIVGYMKAFNRTQCIALVESINSQIKETGARLAGAHELPMTALARRLYIYALKLGWDQSDSARLPTPQYAMVKDELTALCKEIGVEGIEPPGDKDVDNFCGLKVRIRGSSRLGFYLLVSIFILKLDESDEFSSEFYTTAIPSGERKLGRDIFLYLARTLNADAAEKRKTLPFPNIKPARPASDLPLVQAGYRHHKVYGEQAEKFFHEYRVEADGNAHFIVYRSRRSKPSELIKSFLAIEPLKRSSADKDIQFHPTLHIYQAPIDVGRTLRGSPGRIVPLESGLYIVGGQRAEPLRDGKATPLREALPFRTVELMFFPWKVIEGAHLFSGLMFGANNSGTPLVARICARPTLLSRSEDLEMGAVKLSDLAGSLAKDRKKEAAVGADAEDAKKFLSMYDEYGPLEALADRIATACNNGPFDGEWQATGGFQRNEKPLDARAIQREVEDAFPEITLIGNENRPFDPWRDLRFPPLSLE